MVDFLTRLLFEDVVLLVIAEVAAVAVALGVHRRRCTARSRWGLCITLTGCVLLLLLQSIVTTDRERIRETVARLAQAVDDGDLAALADGLDAGFSDGRRNKQTFLADANQYLQRCQVDQVRVGGFQIEVTGDEAVASFRATCDWRRGSEMHASVFGSWRLAFVRRQDGWKLLKVISGKFGPGGMLDYHQAWDH